MRISKIKIIRKNEAKKWYEDDELCHLYREDEEMEFGSSYLEPGKAGAVDLGHNKGKEVFYCALGKVIVEFSEEKIELSKGDAVVIPVKEPHKLINKFDEPTLIVWSLAPPDEK
ncbi:MAG TPA: cupin domain-containing protein [Candidatus Nanopelagicaceae bacterium]|nr:cupin domain-containing protein [Candidatus Nanopelagicaceae bacterium]